MPRRLTRSQWALIVVVFMSLALGAFVGAYIGRTVEIDTEVDVKMLEIRH